MGFRVGWKRQHGVGVGACDVLGVQTEVGGVEAGCLVPGVL